MTKGEVVLGARLRAALERLNAALQRRLALAQTNLDQSQALSAKLHAEAEAPRFKQQVVLLQTRSELEEARQ